MNPPTIEPLEARIAPALLVAANGLSATWTDVDGDLVTLKVSKPILDLGDFTYGPRGLGEQIEWLNFGDDSVHGLDITVTAKPQDVNGDKIKEGDGLVNIGRINAIGVNLGRVWIGGDLGEVDAGNNTGTALKSLTVRSLGERGFDTGAPDLESAIAGRLGTLFVKGNVRDAYVHVTGPFGTIGSITIGGSLLGGATASGGRILSDGNMGPVKIFGDIQGGTATSSGNVASNAKIASISIGGSLIGGTALYAGSINAHGEISSIRIKGDILGSSGQFSGLILGRAKLSSVSIGGSVIGGTNSIAGAIVGETTIGAVSIGGNLVGGTEDSSGSVTAFSSISSVTIGGSVLGAPDGSGSAPASGSIRSVSGALGSVKIKGSLIGDAAHPVVISARGGVTTSSATDIALRSLFVGGRVEWTNILLGYVNSDGANGDAQSGPIVVGGDWIASNLVAGVNATNGYFGDASDRAFVAGVDYGAGPAKNDTTVISRIASITIGGGIFGTNGIPGLEHFGFVAEHIGSFRANGVILALKPGVSNDTFALNASRPVGAGLSTYFPDGFEVHVNEV